MDLDRPPLLGYVVALLGLLAVPHLLSRILGVAVRTWETTGSWPWWFPELWSVGATVARYSQLVDFVSYLVVPLLVFGLGVHFGLSRRGTVGGKEDSRPDARTGE